MNTINNHTLQLLADYLEQYYSVFSYFLNAREIEPTEAEVIIGDLRQAFAPATEHPVIDRKFVITAFNPVNGKTYGSHNAVLLCAKDKAVPLALHAYQKECMRLGANREHIESVGLLIDRVEAFQTHVESRVPDTIGAEIPRCLFGDGI